MKVKLSVSTLILSGIGVGAFVALITWAAASPKPAELPQANSMAGHHQPAGPSSSAAFSALVGQPAPDFSLPSYQGNTVTLSQLRGKKVVLFFNEGLMCYPGCWNQITALTNDVRFSGDNVVALSIVTDPKEQWGTAVDKVPDLAKATVLFDTSGAVSRAYGVLNLPSSMHPGRLPGHTYVVVDAKGEVRFVKDDPAMGINNDELANDLAQL